MAAAYLKRFDTHVGGQWMPLALEDAKHPLAKHPLCSELTVTDFNPMDRHYEVFLHASRVPQVAYHTQKTSQAWITYLYF